MPLMVMLYPPAAPATMLPFGSWLAETLNTAPELNGWPLACGGVVVVFTASVTTMSAVPWQVTPAVGVHDEGVTVATYGSVSAPFTWMVVAGDAPATQLAPLWVQVTVSG